MPSINCRPLWILLLLCAPVAAEVRWKAAAGTPRRLARFLAPDGATLPLNDGSTWRAEGVWGQTVGVMGVKKELAHVRLADGREACAPAAWLLPANQATEAALLDGPEGEPVPPRRAALSATAGDGCRAWAHGATEAVQVPCDRLSRDPADLALAPVIDQVDDLIRQGRALEAVERLKYLPANAAASRLGPALDRARAKAQAALADPAGAKSQGDGVAKTLENPRGCAF